MKWSDVPPGVWLTVAGLVVVLVAIRIARAASGEKRTAETHAATVQNLAAAITIFLVSALFVMFSVL